MEGRCQLTAKQLMSKCGQNANKVSNRGNLPRVTSPGTCHTEILSGEKVYLPEDQRPTMDQEVGGWGKPKGKATSKGRAKPRGQKCTIMAQLRMPVAYIRWPTADLPVNSDY